MSTQVSRSSYAGIDYPDSDGEPMAENTLQFEWIVTIKGNLEILFLDRPDVFVAGDLFWYPVEGDPKTRTAPDAMVAIVKRANDELKMTGTPTFVIDGKVYGGELTIDQLKAILDPLIKK